MAHFNLTCSWAFFRSTLYGLAYYSSHWNDVFLPEHLSKNIKNFIIANLISVAILLFIFKLLLPYTLSYFGYLEVFFVNSIGLPFNSGTIIAGISIILAFYFLLTYTRKKNFVFFNTAILCIMFVFNWIHHPGS